jgi:malonate-semialdehyde dehydrogenase (acetylating)/methylmalonate-semialdehyde dehydrogenase
MLKIGNFIGGKRADFSGSKTIPLYKPTTGEQYADVQITSKEDFDKIIQSMKQAQATWADTAITKRSSILFKYKNLIEKDFDNIAKIISEEHGKVFSDAKGSLQRGLEVVDFASLIKRKSFCQCRYKC